MSFKNFFLNESSDKTTIKLSDASKAQELEQYLSTSSIQFSKTADDVFEIMSPKSVVAKLPFEAEFLDNINESFASVSDLKNIDAVATSKLIAKYAMYNWTLQNATCHKDTFKNNVYYVNLYKKDKTTHQTVSTIKIENFVATSTDMQIIDGAALGKALLELYNKSTKFDHLVNQFLQLS
jgi:hypothetical protein